MKYKRKPGSSEKTDTSSGRPWSGNQTDQLLELLWARASPRAQVGHQALANDMQPHRPGTTAKSVNRRLWGLATAYGGGGVAGKDYQTTANRTNRAGSPWTKDDDWFVQHVFAGAGNCKDTLPGAAYVARITGRTSNEVKQRAERLVGNTRQTPAGTMQGFGLVNKPRD